MAGPNDPFTPGNENPDERVAPEQQNALQGFLTDPRGQAALLQFGLGLMGGRSWGDNPTSQIARAVGGSGEAVRTSEAENRAAEEQASKISARKAAAGGRGASQDQRDRALDIKQQDADTRRKRVEDAGAHFQQRQQLSREKWDGQLAVLNAKLRLSTDAGEQNRLRVEIEQAKEARQAESAKINDEYINAQRENIGRSEEGRQGRFDQGIEQKAREGYAAYRGSLMSRKPLMSFDDWKRTNGYPVDTAAPAPAPAPTTGPTIGAPKKPVTGSPNKTQLAPDFDPPNHWLVDPDKKLYRDPTNNQDYDAHGRPVSSAAPDAPDDTEE